MLRLWCQGQAFQVAPPALTPLRMMLLNVKVRKQGKINFLYLFLEGVNFKEEKGVSFKWELILLFFIFHPLL